MYIQSTINGDVFEVYHMPDQQEFTVRHVTKNTFQNIEQGTYINMMAMGLYIPYEHENIFIGKVDTDGKTVYKETSSDTLLN